MAWRSDFRRKNLSFGFMVSTRISGIVYSATQTHLDYYDVPEDSAMARDAGGIAVNGGSLLSAYNWYEVVGGKNIPQYYAYSATNVRLQPSIGYTVPKEKLGDICEINLSRESQPLDDLLQDSVRPEAVATIGNCY